MSGHRKPITTRPLLVSEWGWLGGLIHGDGSIGLYRVARDKRYRRGFQYLPKLNISTTSPIIRDEVLRLLGGQPGMWKTHQNGSAHKPIFKIWMTVATTRWVLENATIVGKARQRNLLLEAMGLFQKVGGKRPLDSPSDIRLAEICQELHALNQRGQVR